MKRVSIKSKSLIFAITAVLLSVMSMNVYSANKLPRKKAVMKVITKVNDKWQNVNSYEVNPFWDNAAYHTGNMEVYKLTGNDKYLEYSKKWADFNQWKGAKSDNKSKWKYNYGETDKHVLFGDWQICFQTYSDLYNIEPADYKIKRAKEVMEYEMSTPNVDYWWWADGLYMVMPVMTKLYKITGNSKYIEKLAQYFDYSDKLMYDQEFKIYYRDAKYVYPLMPTINGKKNFWSRGNGWVFAGFAKILQDLPEGEFRSFIIQRYRDMAKTLAATQQAEGYWSRSILDEEHAPGRETSGTAFFTYGYFWGINNGILDKKEYLPTAVKGWNYLQKIALQPDSTIGYVQPIGERAIPGQKVDAKSTANFGTGAFLLAACEVYRYLSKK